MIREFPQVKNEKKLQDIIDGVEQLTSLKRAIDGLNDMINDSAVCYKIASDDHSRCEIYGINYNVTKNAFKAAKEVFEKHYSELSHEMDIMLTTVEK